MRVRAFTNRGSTTKVIGKFPSLKTGKSVWWESQIERDMIYLLEFDSDVLTYREQPLRIQYETSGKPHHYTPDFLVQRKDKQQLIEVKPEDEANDPDNQSRFRAISLRCDEEGYQFVLATSDKIRMQPRLNNIKLLWRYSRAPIYPQHVIYCRELLAENDCVRLLDAFKFFESKGTTRATVYALLWRGVLSVDLMKPLCADMLLYPSNILPIVTGEMS